MYVSIKYQVASINSIDTYELDTRLEPLTCHLILYNPGMTDPKQLEKTALQITKAVGSPASIVIHSLLFLGSFLLAFWGFVDFDRMLLLLTTIVSLEAIYLALFIQMTINYQSQSIAEVSADVEELSEDVGEIQEDVEEISEDVGEIQEDMEELQEDVEEISEDVGEISEDVEELQEDVEEISEDEEKEEKEEEKRKQVQKETLDAIHHDLQRLLIDIEKLKKKE
jgi:uncharacterized protein YoxC